MVQVPLSKGIPFSIRKGAKKTRKKWVKTRNLLPKYKQTLKEMEDGAKCASKPKGADGSTKEVKQSPISLSTR